MAVSEDEVADAVRFAWNEHQLLVEPGGAVALAALLAEKRRLKTGPWRSCQAGTWIPRSIARSSAARRGRKVSTANQSSPVPIRRRLQWRTGSRQIAAERSYPRAS